jgi:hypothetical protein
MITRQVECDTLSMNQIDTSSLKDRDDLRAVCSLNF